MELGLNPYFICDRRQLAIRITERGRASRRERLGHLGDLERITRQLVREGRHLTERVRYRGDAEARVVANRSGVACRVDNLRHKNVARIEGGAVTEREDLLRAVRKSLFVARWAGADEHGMRLRFRRIGLRS